MFSHRSFPLISYSLPAVVLLSASTIPAAYAQDTSNAARGVLEKAVGAHKRATAMTLKINGRLTVGGKVVQNTTAEVSYQRPGKAFVVAQSDQKRTIVSDNAFVYTMESKVTGSYLKVPVAQAGDSNIALAIGSSRASMVPVLTSLVYNPQPMISFFQTRAALSMLPEETVGGVPVEVVRVAIKTEDGKNAGEYVLAFGKEDNLLRRATYRSGEGEKLTERTDELTEVKSNPTIAAETFVFTPPAGMVAAAPPPPPDYYDKKIKPGVDPYPITGTDLDGKAVSLEQYKGKVLLLDFWATWCGACIAEMPNVIASYSKYQDKGFDILSISLDNEGDRQKIVSYCEKNNIPWRQIFDGKGWQAENAVRYAVRAIPFTVLIGRDGKVIGVNLRGAALAPAIEAALKK
jgi:outer membrane lipoprotein-sorting protein/peroxiredoxin